MSKTRAITGNGAMAEAMRQINPEVVAAFPITPSTQVIEDFAEFVADGSVADLRYAKCGSVPFSIVSFFVILIIGCSLSIDAHQVIVIVCRDSTK